MRYVALIQPTDLHPPTRHYRGLPPELSGGVDTRQEMPWPRVLLIRQVKRAFFLDRYTAEGEPAGDTWHQDLEEAKDQAEYEYNGALGEWRLVPEEISNDQAIEFALRLDKNKGSSE